MLLIKMELNLSHCRYLQLLVVATYAVAPKMAEEASEKTVTGNMRNLEQALLSGWRTFCEADINEGGKQSQFGNTTIRLITDNDEIVSLPIADYSKIASLNIDRYRPTLLYINAFLHPFSYFSVDSHLRHLQKSRRDLNVIIVNFAEDIVQLQRTVKHMIRENSEIVGNIIETLVLQMGTNPMNISIVGHSVGANIAASGATRAKESKGIQLGQLIVLDPASMCRAEDVSVNANLSAQVVVIHGDGSLFGIRNALGTIDIYPNGVGNAPLITMQPGCTTNLCNHMFPFLLFMESLIERVEIKAVKCNSWLHFRSSSCDYSNIINFGLSYPKGVRGTFFCLTQANPPYTLMEDGLKYQIG